MQPKTITLFEHQTRGYEEIGLIRVAQVIFQILASKAVALISDNYGCGKKNRYPEILLTN